MRLAVTDCEASEPAAALYRTCGFAETGERVEPVADHADPGSHGMSLRAGGSVAK